jgi:hypothetical protein
MEHRTEFHDALSKRESLRSGPEVVLTEEDRPIGPVDPDQPVRGLLDVAEDGFRELVGEHEVFVVCLSIQPPVVRSDFAVACRTHR